MQTQTSSCLPRVEESAAVGIGHGEVRAQAFGQGGEGLVVEGVQQRSDEAPLIAHEPQLLARRPHKAGRKSVSAPVAGEYLCHRQGMTRPGDRGQIRHL